MILLIAGASHTGKTLLSQKLLEKFHYPYLSLDHLKMGFIRSGNTTLTVEDDDKMTAYLWTITKEIIKTAIENKQNLIVEGVYLPFDWKDSFDHSYLAFIEYYCLIFTKDYINRHFSTIQQHANAIEQRIDDSDQTKELLINDNQFNLEMCKTFNCNYILIEDNYNIQEMIDKIKFTS